MERRMQVHAFNITLLCMLLQHSTSAGTKKETFHATAASTLPLQISASPPGQGGIWDCGVPRCISTRSWGGQALISSVFSNYPKM